MIAFTCDVDWAPEGVIEDTLNLFEVFNVKCTFFSTHHSLCLSKSNKKLFEVAIHPDFTPLLHNNTESSMDEILDEILEVHPDSLGVRTHTMVQSIGLLQKFSEKNLLYEANNFMPYQTGLKPFRLWNNLVRIPYNWEDDVHWAYGYSFDECGIDLNSGDLTVFDFHPIHIYLNTENKFRYHEARKYYNDPKKLVEYKNTEMPGTRDLLMNLLKQVKNNNLQTDKMKDIAYSALQNSSI